MFRSGFHFGDPSLPLFTMYGEEMPFFLGIGVVLVAAEAFLCLGGGQMCGSDDTLEPGDV